MEENKLTIEFGPLSSPISQQITKQGFVFEKKGIEDCQKCASALSMLLVFQVLTPSEVEKARKRLVKDIGAYTKPKPSSSI